MTVPVSPRLRAATGYGQESVADALFGSSFTGEMFLPRGGALTTSAADADARGGRGSRGGFPPCRRPPGAGRFPAGSPPAVALPPVAASPRAAALPPVVALPRVAASLQFAASSRVVVSFRAAAWLRAASPRVAA